jgi:hypothetical protein
MKKLILLVVSASFLVASAAYANTTLIINNELTTNNPNDTIWLDGDYNMQLTKSSYWGTSFCNLPKGKNVMSSQWPATFINASIEDITGFYIDNSGNGHDFVASPSCENIKIIPNATNLIDVTSGTTSPLGSDKTRATVCTVSYSEQE